MIKKHLIRSAYYTLAMLLVYFLLNTFLTGNVWEGITLSKSALMVEYCEFNDPQRFFHQSMNTYSNLVYFFLGVFICQIATHDAQNQGLRRGIGWLNFHYCPI